MSEEQVVSLPQKEIRINNDYAISLISDYKRKSLSSSELDTDQSIPIIEKRSLTTRDYFQKLSKSFLTSSTVLPPNCRYIEKLNRGHIVVIEDPPCKRTIMVDTELQSQRANLISTGKITEEEFPIEFLNSKPYKFNVALPYMIFLFFIETNRIVCGEVYGRVSRLTGLADYLLKIPLPNISSDQYICFGNGTDKRCNSLNHAIEHAQNTFWNATFNVDYTYNITAYKNVPIVNNYFEWMSMSQKDPMFIYDIPWVKWKNNLIDEIRKMKNHVNASSAEQLTFKELEDIFVRPMPTGKTEVPFEGSKVKQELMYDIAQGVYITHNDKDLFLHVGDNIKDTKGRKLFINSFIGMGSSEHIKYISMYREDKKSLVFKFTKQVSKFIFDQVDAARYTDTVALKNGVVVKANDIIKIIKPSGNTYGKVQFIRQGRQYGHQIKIGSDFYIAENLDAEVFDIKQPEIFGKKLKEKEKYLFIRSAENIPLFHASLVKYDGIDINSSGNMIAMFKCTDKIVAGQALPLSINDNKDRARKNLILDKSEFMVSKFPSFRCGKRTLILRYNSSTPQPENSVFFTQYGVGIEKNYKSQNLKIEEAEKHFINGDSFVSESYNLNINFTIGEKVIAADWRNPLEMLMVKTITGFKVDHEFGKIYFILSDKNNKISQVEYFNAGNGIMNVGKIRKIVNEINGVKAGTKIISKGSSRVSGFPKKDVNIIIGFLIDGETKEPLVLCSNCQTLWFSDLENFELVKYKTKKWDRLEHAPIDISKIKYQPGDVIQGVTDVITGGGWLVWGQQNARMRVTPIEYFISYADSYALDGKLLTHTLLDSIPNPRLTSGQLTEMGLVGAYPNFHGGFTKCDFSPFLVPNDPRSFLNV